MALMELGQDNEARAELDKALRKDRYPRRAPPWFSPLIIPRRGGQSRAVCDVAGALDAQAAHGFANNDEFLDPQPL